MRYLLADMANSGNNLESYRFVTETVQKIEGLSTSTESSELEITSLEEGAVNVIKVDLNTSTRYGDYNRPLVVKLPEVQRIEPMFLCACR